jgi:hypothetical protein
LSNNPFRRIRTPVLSGTFAAVLGSFSALAQSPGTFTQTGNLTTPRQFHTATLLPNGKVLLTGGYTMQGSLTGTIPFSCEPTASAEIYDSSTGSFAPTGAMTAVRFMHSATLLSNGKVLIAGGRFQNGGPGETSAELYDPATGTFQRTGSMATARANHTATLLNNGRVLMVGGDRYSQTAEIYDPATGIFSVTGDMTEPGADTATLLPNGKVLITRSAQFGEDHADLYDRASGTFARTGDIVNYSTAGQYPLAIPGPGPSAVLLTNGKVLITGGAFDVFYSAIAELYDPATGAFNATGTMTAGIGYWQAAALLPEGKVLITGESDGRYGAAGEVYDPAAGTFSPPFEAPSQEGHAATLLPDGTILLSGGWVCCGHTLATAQIYHPAVLLPSPVLFSLRGSAQGAILHGSTHRIVSDEDPALAGEAIEIYAAGLIDGAVIPPQVGIGGQIAEVLYFGAAPGYLGLNQINVRVPKGVATGPAVPVRLDYLFRPSNEVTIAVQ